MFGSIDFLHIVWYDWMGQGERERGAYNGLHEDQSVDILYSCQPVGALDVKFLLFKQTAVQITI